MKPGSQSATYTHLDKEQHYFTQLKPFNFSLYVLLQMFLNFVLIFSDSCYTQMQCTVLDLMEAFLSILVACFRKMAVCRNFLYCFILWVIKVRLLFDEGWSQYLIPVPGERESNWDQLCKQWVWGHSALREWICATLHGTQFSKYWNYFERNLESVLFGFKIWYWGLGSVA